MKNSVPVTSLFPKHLFWDLDIESLDFQADSDVIIPRALYLTNSSTFESDIKKLECIYSSFQIVEQLKVTKELISNEVCKWVAARYAVPEFYRLRKNK